MARWEFEAIYKAFSRMVYWAAYGVTKSESDAGDVTQETFIRALKNADKLKDMEEAQIKAWLYRVCINLCMDNKRRLKREQLSDELPEISNVKKQSVQPVLPCHIQIVIHARHLLSNAFASFAFARAMRDFTVPSLTPCMAAISPY